MCVGQSNGDVEIPPKYFSKSRFWIFWIFNILLAWGLMFLSGCISMRKNYGYILQLHPGFGPRSFI